MRVRGARRVRHTPTGPVAVDPFRHGPQGAARVRDTPSAGPASRTAGEARPADVAELRETIEPRIAQLAAYRATGANLIELDLVLQHRPYGLTAAEPLRLDRACGVLSVSGAGRRIELRHRDRFAAWNRLFARPRPVEPHPFRELAEPVRRAVATPGDLLFHISAVAPAMCTALVACSESASVGDDRTVM
jgi:Dyp-type peroxidase family